MANAFKGLTWLKMCLCFCFVGLVFGQSICLNWPAGQGPVLALGRRRPGHDTAEAETSDLLWSWTLNGGSLKFLE